MSTVSARDGVHQNFVFKVILLLEPRFDLSVGASQFEKLKLARTIDREEPQLEPSAYLKLRDTRPFGQSHNARENPFPPPLSSTPFFLRVFPFDVSMLIMFFYDPQLEPNAYLKLRDTRSFGQSHNAQEVPSPSPFF